MTAELRCKVYPGMFSTEFAVVVEDCEGQNFSLFAPRDTVRVDREPTLDEPVDGWMKVQLVKRAGNVIAVWLPDTTMEGCQYLTVRLDQLAEVPESVMV
jgi:hypothetical protein